MTWTVTNIDAEYGVITVSGESMPLVVLPNEASKPEGE